MTTTDRRGVSVDATDTAIAGSPNPGLAIKAPCLVGTLGNITLSGLQTIDGVALAAGNRVLVWQQTDQTTNGLYNVSTGTWTRTIDANSNDKWAAGMSVAVSGGATLTGDLFQVTSTDPITLGTTNITFLQGNPVPAARNINTTAPLAGGGTLGADRTLSLTIGATFATVGGALQTIAATGDVTWSANSYVTTITALAVTTAKLAGAAVTYAKMQNVAASRLLGNPTGGATSASEITLGSTLAFSGSALQTAALTGDVTASANSFATTVAKIAGTTVSGTTGTVNAVFSNSPTLVTPVLGTATATKITAANGLSNGFTLTAAAGTNGALAMGAGGALVFTLGSTVDSFAVNDHNGNTVFSATETVPGTANSTAVIFSGQLSGADIATTASAANAFIDTGAGGQLKRSTSSLVYKRDVEPLDPAIALHVLSAAEPIWYRSKCAGDNQAWSFYGLGAEDMAAVDPRLVHFGYQDDDFEDVTVPDLDRGEPFTKVERRRKAGATLKPDGVQYERLVPHLLAGWQAHEARIASLEARIVALESMLAKVSSSTEST